MTWSACQGLLDTRMNALPGLDASRVAWPNLDFTAPTEGIHYRVSFLPNRGWAPYGTGTYRRFAGNYQVSIFAPVGSGDAALRAAVDAVCSHFDRLTLTGAVNITTGTPVPAGQLLDGSFVHVPVTVPFETR